ncbi:MAG: hypothetical protein AAFX99_13505, partial [Myxococcota bacterium]
EALVGSLGFRTARDVRLDEVVDHIASRVEEAAPLPFRVYLWMDKGLGEGWLSRQELKERLKPLRWVCTDDGSYFNHRHVLGVQALPLFGQRRGYWQQGLERCPHLCNLFQIAPEVTSTMVAHFLREIGNDVVDQGDQPLLQENPALPRMLLNCYAALGAEVKGVPRLAPVILAEQRGGKTPGAQRLVSASTRNLLRSDTPTLEAMFEGVGTFFLAARGGAEERSSIAQFHDALGVRRLRDAYTLKVDEAGQDRSTARSLQLNALRGVLRALLGVLPRVQAQRTLLTEEGWVFDERLRALAGSGRLKAIEQLRVSYQLVGVGTVQSESSAVYDPSRGLLMVDTRVLDDLEGYTTGLAVGLMPCIYDGPGEDQLVDIVEILLPRRSRERMDAYLNRRHFPEASRRHLSPLERLGERLDTLLDFRLDARLRRRFPNALGNATFERWRDPELRTTLAGDEPPEDETALIRHAVPLLWDAAGVHEPSDVLLQALSTILSAPTLDDIPADLLAAAPHDLEDTLPPLEASQAQGRIARLRSLSDRLGVTATPPSNQTHHTTPGSPTALTPGNGLAASPLSLGNGTVLPPAPGSRTVLPPSGAPRRPLSGGGVPNLMDLIAQARAHRTAQTSSGVGLPSSASPTDRPSNAPQQPLSTSPGSAPRDIPGAADLFGIPEIIVEQPPSRPQPPPPQPKTPGFWGRMAQWLGLSEERQPTQNPSTQRPAREGGRSPQAAQSPLEIPAALRSEFSAPAWAQAGANSFAPGPTIRPQLWRSMRKTVDEVASHPTTSWLRFAPSPLPRPYTYAVQTLGAVFAEHSQSWEPLPDVILDPWMRGELLGRQVVVEGRLMPGPNQLPVPLHGRIAEGPTTTPHQGTLKPMESRSPGLWIKVQSNGPVEVRYTVALLEAPRLVNAAPHMGTGSEPPQALTVPSLTRAQLPREVQEWLQAQEEQGRPDWAKAIAVQEFVQRRYVYDDAFMSRPEVQQALTALKPGQGNHHLELLHASGRGEVLGYGVCYELNVLVVELLRHLEVPALVATGWLLNDGLIDRPDHLFALAIVPSVAGPTLLPLDAATGPQGPHRAIPRSTAPSAPRSTQLSPPPVTSVPGPWSAPVVHNAPDAVEQQLEVLEQAEHQRLMTEEQALRRGLLMVGVALNSAEGREALEAIEGVFEVEQRVVLLRQALDALLPNPESARVFVGLLRGDHNRFHALSPALQELAELGLVRIRQLSLFQVEPAELS